MLDSDVRKSVAEELKSNQPVPEATHENTAEIYDHESSFWMIRPTVGNYNWQAHTHTQIIGFSGWLALQRESITARQFWEDNGSDGWWKVCV